jgi:orotidine-5'-phosphate decarboxylase
VLTSLDAGDLASVWGRNVGSVTDEVSRLAALAQAARLDGIVAAASDAGRIRREVGRDFLLVVPGIRPAGTGADDQRRVATPADAVRAGADYLVVGRVVTRAADPAAALRALLAEVAGAAARTA